MCTGANVRLYLLLHFEGSTRSLSITEFISCQLILMFAHHLYFHFSLFMGLTKYGIYQVESIYFAWLILVARKVEPPLSG